jgi:hypothetical protein
VPSLVGWLCGLSVSKRGVDDGNQKGGGSPQPAQESHSYYSRRKYNVKGEIQLFF